MAQKEQVYAAVLSNLVVAKKEITTTTNKPKRLSRPDMTQDVKQALENPVPIQEVSVEERKKAFRFVESPEVYARPADADPPEDPAEKNRKAIDVEELLRPLFDELLEAGKTEKEMVQALQGYMDEQMKTLTEENKGIVVPIVDGLFGKAQEELERATAFEKERNDKLFNEIKDQVEEEADVLKKKLSSGSFRQNFARLAAHKQRERDEAEWKEKFNVQNAEIKALKEQLDKEKKARSTDAKSFEERLAKEKAEWEKQRASAAPTAKEKPDPAAGKWKQEKTELEDKLRRLAKENEDLTKVVTELRHFRAKMQQMHAQHRMEQQNGFRSGSNSNMSPGALAAAAAMDAMGEDGDGALEGEDGDAPQAQSFVNGSFGGVKKAYGAPKPGTKKPLAAGPPVGRPAMSPGVYKMNGQATLGPPGLGAKPKARSQGSLHGAAGPGGTADEMMAAYAGHAGAALRQNLRSGGGVGTGPLRATPAASPPANGIRHVASTPQV
eukprot:tig00001095_g7040.t1